MSFTRKYLSADGLHKTVKHSLLREQFKEMNSAYTWQDCIMSGLAVFGFKFPSLLQFEKDKAAEPWIRRNLRTLYGVEKAPSDTCMRERLDIVSPRESIGIISLSEWPLHFFAGWDRAILIRKSALRMLL